jgi:hypothetical protein
MGTRGRVAIYLVHWAESRFSKNSGAARFVRRHEADAFADNIRAIYPRVRVQRELVSIEFRDRVAREPINL